MEVARACFTHNVANIVINWKFEVFYLIILKFPTLWNPFLAEPKLGSLFLVSFKSKSKGQKYSVKSQILYIAGCDYCKQFSKQAFSVLEVNLSKHFVGAILELNGTLNKSVKYLE